MLSVAEIVVTAIIGLSFALMLITVTNRTRQRLAQPVIDDDYAGIRRKIEARYKRRGEFGLHVVLFLALSAAFWFIIPMPQMAAFWLTAAWGLVLAAHGVKVLFDEAQERAIDREIARVQGYEDVKPKRTALELNDDGELVEINRLDEDENPRRDYHQA